MPWFLESNGAQIVPASYNCAADAASVDVQYRFHVTDGGRRWPYVSTTSTTLRKFRFNHRIGPWGRQSAESTMRVGRMNQNMRGAAVASNAALQRAELGRWGD